VNFGNIFFGGMAMKMKVIKASIIAALLSASGAQSAPLTFDLDYYIGTGSGSTGVAVTIEEAATAGDVHFTINNLMQGFLNEILFNYVATGDIAGGVISNFVATNGVVGSPSVKYNGTQGFALIFDFPNSPGPNFIFGESVSFDLSANADLTVSGFNNLGGGPSGDDYYVVAHVNGASGVAKIGDINGGLLVDNLGSGEPEIAAADIRAAVPEPNTLWLLAFGVLGFLGRSSKSKLSACRVGR
jgi:hypothetical protein